MASTGTRRSLDLNFPIEVALGNVGGVTALRKYGMNDVVGTGTYDMWPLASVMVWPSVAATISVVSSSANDAAAGTGARTIMINGLDSSYAEISETVTMNGATPVVTVAQFLRVNSVFAVTAGSGGVNAGNITGTLSGNTIFYVEATQGAAHQMQYTVPAGKTLLVLNTRYGTGRFQSSGDCHILAQVRPLGGAWRSLQDIYLYQNIYQPSVVGGESIPEKTDIRALVVSTINTQAFGEFAGWLITN